MDFSMLDQFEDFKEGYRQNVRVVAVKFFYFESQAHLYAARLKEAGIPSFISNPHTSTVIPFAEGSIGLHVHEKDAKPALEIISQLDKQSNQDPEDISYHDADLEDIYFEKELHEWRNRTWTPASLIVLFLIAVLLLFSILRAMGIIDPWFSII